MKKTEKTKLANTLARMSTKKLEEVNSTLSGWEENHKSKKNSYFWTNWSDDYKEQAAKEHTFSAAIKLGGAKITYRSKCAVDGKFFDWTDGLRVDGLEGEATFGDIKYIKATIAEIIAKRSGEVPADDSRANERPKTPPKKYFVRYYPMFGDYSYWNNCYRLAYVEAGEPLPPSEDNWRPITRAEAEDLARSETWRRKNPNLNGEGGHADEYIDAYHPRDEQVYRSTLKGRVICYERRVSA